MYDPLVLIIVAITLVETSFLLVRNRRKSFRGDRAILVDTSVLIDGRILDIAQSGFVPGRLVIPRSVLGELQLLADGSDHEKRARARNGLEVITKLQALPAVSIEIFRDDSTAREGVDNRLLALAGKFGFELCTVDFNLQKVAEAEGITILSINELSRVLRALYLPGEKLDLTLKQKGQEKGQAVGYANDGTMVVVDNADKLLEKTVSVEVIRSLQTNSGKMMFAKLVSDVPHGSSAPTPTPRRQNLKPARGFRTSKAQPVAAPEAVEVPVTPAPRQAAPKPTPTAEAPQAKPQGNRRSFGRRSNRPASPEDSLMDLVNKQ